jgi:hypothetical protein
MVGDRLNSGPSFLSDPSGTGLRFQAATQSQKVNGPRSGRLEIVVVGIVGIITISGRIRRRQGHCNVTEKNTAQEKESKMIKASMPLRHRQNKKKMRKPIEQVVMIGYGRLMGAQRGKYYSSFPCLFYSPVFILRLSVGLQSSNRCPSSLSSSSSHRNINFNIIVDLL